MLHPPPQLGSRAEAADPGQGGFRRAKEDGDLMGDLLPFLVRGRYEKHDLHFG